MKREVCIIASLAFVSATAVLLLTLILSGRASASGGVKLRPPFYRADGTYRVTAYFDHDEPSYGTGADGYIQIYTGERVASSYINKTGEPYPYDGHDGWDWSMITGTNVLAAAAGTVVVSQNDYPGGYGHTIIIAHNNGYYTMYSHLHQRLVGVGATVVAGQHIAESGRSGGVDPHLHFGVRHGGWANTTYAVDPFGWHGEGRDPLFNYNGEVSTCLWRSCDEDPISCADTIVEDTGQGFYKSGAWDVSTLGNGYHMYYRYNTDDSSVYATWRSTTTVAGPHNIYVYVPSQYATTYSATYWIYTVDDWKKAPIVNQWSHSDEWVSLGTYILPANNAYVWMWADTDEQPPRWIAADAVKFRQYRNHLPLAMRDYTSCSPSYGQLIVNGTFGTGDDTGWTTSRPDIVQLHSGSDYGAWLGRYNFNQDQMYQRVCPGTPASYATLSFMWKVTTNDTPYVGVDFLYVRLRDANGNLLQTLKTISNISPRDQWYYAYYDLRAYAGQEIRISFEASTDGSYPTDFWIDNVGFVVSD